jgi:hypothetical protein
MWKRFATCSLAAVILVGLAGGAARADEDYDRVTVMLNAPYLLVPVYELSAELAVREGWGAAIRGGGGVSDLGGEDRTIVEVGAQGIYYVLGNNNRGVQLGLDTRYVSYEDGGQLMGIGDGVAVGPFVGYKRVFGSGVTLGVQLGAQVALSGDSESPVFPFLTLGLGVSAWSTSEPGDAEPASSATSGAPGASPEPTELIDPLDHHRRFMIGFSLGGGAITGEVCEGCAMGGGIAVDGSIGWFVHRRVAVMYDATAAVGAFSTGFGTAGVGVQGVAVQYWPLSNVWLKVSVGATQLISSSVLGVPENKVGGGGTLGAGYEFHQNGNFNMDIQLRVSHASFDQDDGTNIGIDTFAGLVGVNWY